MTKKTFNIMLLFLISFHSFAQKRGNSNRDSSLIVKLNDFGKCAPLTKAFYQTSGIAPMYITSAFYFVSNDKTGFSFIPVNDKVFNYDYFQKYIYPNLGRGDSVKLMVKKYFVNKKEILVATKIEKIE